MPYDTKITHGPRLPMASEAGQRPPTDAEATRQRYQLGCHEGGGGGSNSVASQPKSRSMGNQSNRRSGRY